MKAFPRSSLMFLALAVAGCGEDTILVQPPTQENRAPTIVRQGPDDFAPLLNDILGYVPSPWVVVSDPDGSDDIAAVILEVENVVVHRALLRPVIDTAGCPYQRWADNDTLDTAALAFPTSFHVDPVSMIRESGGPYVAEHSPFRIDPLYSADSFGTFIGGICCPCDFLTVFLVEEPYLVPAQPVFLTLLDVEYEGIRVTAYDAAGATAVATFPNVRVCWETGPERLFAP